MGGERMIRDRLEPLPEEDKSVRAVLVRALR
jgi:hypothetical protein